MNEADGRKSIFITGAASGMGRETALLFARKGWFVGAFDVNRAGLDTLRAELGADNGHFAMLDVTDQAAFAQAVEAFGATTGGKLDLLFNNAGIGVNGMFDEIAWDDLMRVLNVNLIGVMIGIRAAMPLMKATPNALSLITSSSSAIWGSAGIAIYSATKHAVRGLTEALTVEFKRYGIRAADLLPGLIDTPLLPDSLRAMAPPNGMWRLVHPSEVAETVWQAYHSEKLHWYVPAELQPFAVQVATDPDTVRDERTALFAAMSR